MGCLSRVECQQNPLERWRFASLHGGTHYRCRNRKRRPKSPGRWKLQTYCYCFQAPVLVSGVVVSGAGMTRELSSFLLSAKMVGSSRYWKVDRALRNKRNHHHSYCFPVRKAYRLKYRNMQHPLPGVLEIASLDIAGQLLPPGPYQLILTKAQRLGC